MEVPAQFRQFPCDEYFASPWAESGLWDELSKTMLVLAASSIEHRADQDFLVVSRLQDGVELGYRMGHDGIWAYVAAADDFVLMTPTLRQFVDTFYAGREGAAKK